MPIKPEKILITARHLMQNGRNTNEEFLRSASSRAYYAAYHKAKIYALKHNLLVDQNQLPPNKNVNSLGSHEKVIFQFEHSKSQNEVDIGKTLRELRVRRCEADYDLDLLVKYSNVQQQIRQADDLIRRL